MRNFTVIIAFAFSWIIFSCQKCFSSELPGSKAVSLYDSVAALEGSANRTALSVLEAEVNRELSLPTITSADKWLLCSVLGAIKVELFETDTAIMILEEALKNDSLLFGANSSYTLYTFKYLSWAYGYSRNLEKEQEFSYKLLDYYTGKKDTLHMADLMNTIGQNFGSRGDRYTEQFYLNRSKILAESFHPLNSDDSSKWKDALINNFSSFSISYLGSENPDDAIKYSEICISEREKYMNDLSQQVISYMILGRAIYEKDQNAELAISFLNRAINAVSANKADPRWISYNSYLIDILIKSGQLNEAIKHASYIISEEKKAGDLDIVSLTSLVGIYNALSNAYFRSGMLDKAIQNCIETERFIKNMGGVNNVLLSTTNVTYGKILASQSKFSDSKRKIAFSISTFGIDSMKILNKTYNIPYTLTPLNLMVIKDYGHVLVQEGMSNKNCDQVKEGIDLMKRVMLAYNAQIVWLYQAGLNEGKSYNLLSMYEDLLNDIYRTECLSKDEKADLAWNIIEASKANLLKKAINDEYKLNKQLSEEDNRQRLELKAAMIKQFQVCRAQPSIENEKMLNDLKGEYVQFINKKVSTNALNDKPGEKQNVTDNTTTNELILNYFFGQNALYVVKFKSGEKESLSKPILKDFANDLEFARKLGLTAKYSADAKVQDRLSSIYEKWFEWLIGNVSPDEKIIVIPHRDLSYISFEMLRNKTAYLIENATVHYAISYDMLTQKRTRSQKKSVFGGFYCSEFEPLAKKQSTLYENLLAERGGLDKLTGTEEEVENISGLIGGKIFGNVTGKVFLDNAERFSILHLATHALSDQGAYHQCNLVFEGKDNVVTDGQIGMMKLDNDMTVLSACNTGVGNLHNGEGLLSLGRSFFIAGSRSVVMSLWTVNDESTTKIMSSFYNNLSKGQLKSEALRNAKLEYLKNEKDESKKTPYYWAGFIIVGDDSPLKESFGMNTMQIILIVSTILLILGVLYYFSNRRKVSA